MRTAFVLRLQLWYHCFLGLFPAIFMHGFIHQAIELSRGKMICGRWYLPLRITYLGCSCGKEYYRSTDLTSDECDGIASMKRLVNGKTERVKVSDITLCKK